MGIWLTVSWTYNRCRTSGNRKNAIGGAGIRQKRNVTPESIGLVGVKAQADILNKLRCFRFLYRLHTKLLFGSFFCGMKPGPKMTDHSPLKKFLGCL